MVNVKVINPRAWRFKLKGRTGKVTKAWPEYQTAMVHFDKPDDMQWLFLNYDEIGLDRNFKLS